MNGRIVWWLSSALVVSVAACGGDGGGGTEPPQPGAISGSVATSSAGVGGAAIALTGPATRNTTTAATGEYSFANLNAGNYTLTLTLPTGFQLGTGENLAKNATVAAGQTAQVNWTLVASGGNGNDGTRVEALASSFSPAEVTIPVGGSVTFVGATGGHTVTPDNPNQTGAWTGFNLGVNQEVTVTFNTAGTFDYHCIPHEALGMRGKIIVGNN